MFVKVIPQITPRIYDLSQMHPRPVVAYSDAEWTPPEHPPLAPGRGLGGCIIFDDEYLACSVATPMQIVNSLAPRDTQIIPLMYRGCGPFGHLR